MAAYEFSLRNILRLAFTIAHFQLCIQPFGRKTLGLRCSRSDFYRADSDAIVEDWRKRCQWSRIWQTAGVPLRVHGSSLAFKPTKCAPQLPSPEICGGKGEQIETSSTRTTGGCPARVSAPLASPARPVPKS